jgi:hypothetical protein
VDVESVDEVSEIHDGSIFRVCLTVYKTHKLLISGFHDGSLMLSILMLRSSTLLR